MSAVFAASGHDVVAFDDGAVVQSIDAGALPVAEPGLIELIRTERDAGRLRYSADAADLRDRDIVWITFDTEVADDGSANPGAIVERVVALFGALAPGTLVVVSSQLPVGSIAELERRATTLVPGARLRFASSPENLRLGSAIAYMRDADRFVIGVRTETDAADLKRAFEPLTERIETMGVESAEMTKHALNGFLATSVAFINEIAALCEATGADARDVERGLKSDVRIGKRAYLRAGGAYAGGTLARDVGFLIDAERRNALRPHLLEGVRAANDYHALWLERRYAEVVGEPASGTVALLGLTYKPGTDTLRASTAVAFARAFARSGGRVRAYDPAIRELPNDLRDVIHLSPSPAEAMDGADATLVTTEWPEFREIPAATFEDRMRACNVFDPGRYLEKTFQNRGAVRYYAIGVSSRKGSVS